LRHPYFSDNPITDYNDMRDVGVKRRDALIGKFKGDPEKAVVAICDVVKGEGVAKGRDWPLYLFFGEEGVVKVHESVDSVGRVEGRDESSEFR
jgi:hypothetical protein